MVLDPKQAAITEYTPAYTPNDAWVRNRWGPSEDIFQLGLLACTLLTGESWTKDDLSSIGTLDVDDDFKCWIWHATAAKAKKYVDGADALEALDTLADVNMRSGRAPTRIRGQVVTLTGKLESGTRAEVTRDLRSAGAVVQDAVGDSTTPQPTIPQIDVRRLYIAMGYPDAMHLCEEKQEPSDFLANPMFSPRGARLRVFKPVIDCPLFHILKYQELTPGFRHPRHADECVNQANHFRLIGQELPQESLAVPICCQPAVFKADGACRPLAIARHSGS